MATYEDLIHPEISQSLIGCKIKILNDCEQSWVKPGQVLTVKEITHNKKLRFEEIKYAWGCKNNRKNKYFKVSIKELPRNLVKQLPVIEQIYFNLDLLLLKVADQKGGNQC
jgi:hypothetical protein